MDKIAIDASVVLKWFPGKNEEQEEIAVKVYDLILQGQIKAFAPSFLLVETVNILFHKRKINNKLITKAIKELIDSGINFVDLTKEGIADINKNMIDYKITAYDAIYLSIAKNLRARLLTFDKELLKIKHLTISIGEYITKTR